MDKLDSLLSRLPKELSELIKGLDRQEADALEEIRIYLNRPVELMIAGQRRRTELSMNGAHIDGLLAALSGFALYRFEQQMAEGYMPLEGGHRVGVCGMMTRQNDGIWRMVTVTSVCLRIARRIDGASAPIREHLFTPEGRPRRVLLLGAPGCGKTTVLRDAALYMARDVRVAVADEREELFAQSAKEDKGALDVLGGADKARAFAMLIRSMSPQAIVCDELGREEDVQAVLDAARCGVSVLASAHADGLEDMLRRPVLQRLFDAGVFERYVHLGFHGSVLSVWDERGRRIEGKERLKYGGLGCGGDGDDRREQRRISLVGRGKEACSLDSGDAQMSAAFGGMHSL